MDDKTTLFVMGDHGMTVSGDHGGDTDDETNALLFAYTKQGKFLKNEFNSDNTTLQQVCTLNICRYYVHFILFIHKHTYLFKSDVIILEKVLNSYKVILVLFV